ncbi:MAG: hypothetical protein HQM10_15460 [Candidatus Riflebacteria bacterium]|nr:hypothetical protein [Candidatus Riflebacteria bacterium]
MFRRAFSLMLVLFAVVAVSFFFFTLSSINKTSRLRMSHINKDQVLYHIANYAFFRQLAVISESGWDSRPFKTSAFRENKVPGLGGEYDVHIENASKDYQADIYIRTRFSGQAKLFFWRVAFREDLLDVSNRIKPILFKDIPTDYYPTSSTSGGTFSGKVDEILTQRKNNEKKSNEITSQIQVHNDVRDITRIVIGSDVGASSPVDVPLPPSNEIALTKPGLPTIPFPSGHDGKGARYRGGIYLTNYDYSYTYSSAKTKEDKINEEAKAAATNAKESADKASESSAAAPAASGAAAEARAASDAASAAASAAAAAAADAVAIANGTQSSGMYATAAEAWKAADAALAEAKAAEEAAKKAEEEAKAAAEAAAAAAASTSTGN